MVRLGLLRLRPRLRLPFRQLLLVLLLLVLLLLLLVLRLFGGVILPQMLRDGNRRY